MLALPRIYINGGSRGFLVQIAPEVIVKLLKPELARDREFVERFLREARSGSRISHPNVIGIYDAGHEGEQLYMACQLVRGGDLAQLLHGRPDGVLTEHKALSILIDCCKGLQALHDAGVPASDPALQRALVFLRRTQMDDRVNEMPYAQGSRQGGFVYATSENKETLGSGQSMAGTMDESLPDGTTASRLRCYGSMTYAGFKAMIYADLKRDDPRVRAAYDWLSRNYTVKENPGVGTDGLYYYYLTMARALAAWGEEQIPAPPDADAAPDAPTDAPSRDWRADLIAQLATLQTEDGSFRPVDDRWMEDNPVLITAYALIALQEMTR